MTSLALRTAPAVRAQAHPIVKWVGGKTKLLPELLARMPAQFGRYYEPFAGGAALFFRVAPERAVLSDANADLMTMYRAVAEAPTMVIDWLHEHEQQHCKSHFLAVRDSWNGGVASSPSRRAGQFLYLNRVCFNGLWRVNRAGEFNVGFGDYANPTICDHAAIMAASRAMQGVELRCGDYRAAVADAEPGDFVYFDPPYLPVTATANFTSYTADGFGVEQHLELAETARELAGRGVSVLLSNSDTPLVRELYADFEIAVVRCARAINSDATKRGQVDELVIASRPEQRATRTAPTRIPMTKKRPEQLQVPGTEPVEPHPAIRVALDAWLAARDDAKDARQAVSNTHDVLLDALQEAKVPYYSYDYEGRRKRVFPSAEPKLKTSTISTPKPSGRRGRAKDVEMPIDKERAKAVEKLETAGARVDAADRVLDAIGEAVEHRKVRRSEVVDDSDPFAATRGLLDEARARQGGAV